MAVKKARLFLACALLAAVPAIAQGGGTDASPSNTNDATVPSSSPPANDASAGTATHSTGGPVYKMGNGVTPPQLTFGPDPIYPQSAKKRKAEGTSLVSIIVDPEGRPHNIHIVRPGDPDLDAAAIEAVKQYQFDPAMKDGKPVPMIMTVEVAFHLCKNRSDCAEHGVNPDGSPLAP